jgi:hypothetical protein
MIYGDDGPSSVRVTVRDISASGLGFISHQAMEAGTELICKLLRFDQTKVELKMKIRHCVPVSKGLYKIGASFDRTPFLPVKVVKDATRDAKPKRAEAVVA